MIHLPTRNWHLTRTGWLWLLVALGVLGLGIAKNINLLAILGMMLVVLLLLSAFVVGRRLNRLEAHRHLDPLLFAGTTCHVEVRLHNRGEQPCQGVAVEDQHAGRTLTWYLDRVEGAARRGGASEIQLPGRGWHDWGPLEAVSGYPFGLIRWRAELLPLTRVLILPLPGKMDRERLRRQLRGADPRGERVRRRGWRHEGAQADFHGLRPFRPGDSPRWIHWRTTARRGQLMVREFEDVPGDDLILVLGGGDVEAVITAAAGLCWEWCRRRGDRLVLVAGTTVLDGLTGPEHARALLECLAVLPADHLPEPDLACLRELPATLAIVFCSAGAAVPAALQAQHGDRVTLLDVQKQNEEPGPAPPC